MELERTGSPWPGGGTPYTVGGRKEGRRDRPPTHPRGSSKPAAIICFPFEDKLVSEGLAGWKLVEAITGWRA